MSNWKKSMMSAAGGGGGYFSLMGPYNQGAQYASYIKYDTANDYIVNGRMFYDYTSGKERMIFTSFDLDGNINWQKEIGDGNGSNRRLGHFDLDNSGNIYILGAGMNTNDTSYPGMIKLNSSGAVQWTKEFYLAPSMAQSIQENAVMVDKGQNHVHFSYDWNYQGNAHFTLFTSNGNMPSSPYATYMQHHGVSSGSDNYMEHCLACNSNYIVSGGRYYDYSSTSSARRHDFTLGAFDTNFQYLYGSSQSVRNTSYGPMINDIVDSDSSHFLSIGKIQPDTPNPTSAEYDTILKSYVDASDSYKHKYVACSRYGGNTVGALNSISKQSDSSGNFITGGYISSKLTLAKFNNSLTLGQTGYWEGSNTVLFGIYNKDYVCVDKNGDIWVSTALDISPSVYGQPPIIIKMPNDFSVLAPNAASPLTHTLADATKSIKFYNTTQYAYSPYLSTIPAFSGRYISTQSMASKGYSSISLQNRTIQQDTSPNMSYTSSDI